MGNVFIVQIVTFILGLWIASFLGKLLSKAPSRLDRERFKQLNFEAQNESILNIIVKPILKHLAPIWPVKPVKNLANMLWVTGWDKYFTIATFTGLNIFTSIAGTLLGLLLIVGNSSPPGFLLGVLLIVGGWYGLPFFLNNEYNLKTEAILKDFPHLSRVMYGYVHLGLPIFEAIKKSIQHASPEWQRILKEFLVIAELKSLGDAILWLKGLTDVSVIRDFASLIKLVEDRGGAVEALKDQVNRLEKIQHQINLKKITTREIYVTALQFPLLITGVALIMVPTIVTMMGL